jgi:hypothetical protein
MSTEVTTNNDDTIISGFVNRGLVNTLHPQSWDERKAAYNTLSGAVSLDDIGDKVIEIVGINQVNGTRIDRDTQIEHPAINTTLVGVDGTGYFSQSMGIARDAYNIVSMFGEKWPEPIKISVKKIVLPNKNTLKHIEIK